MSKKRWLVLPGLVIVALWWWIQRPGAEAVRAQYAAITLGHPQTTVPTSAAVGPVVQTPAAPAQAVQIDSGGFPAMRERLVGKLQLDASQREKLDTILAALQPRFQALDNLDVTARPTARAKLVSELQLKINEMLTPDQRGFYEQLQARAYELKQGRAAAKPTP